MLVRAAGVGAPGYRLTRGHPQRGFEHATGTKSFRRVGKDFRAAIAANSDYSNHGRKFACAVPLLYLAGFGHTLRSDDRDQMAQFVFDVARGRDSVSNLLSQ